MIIVRTAAAGTVESSDCRVTVSPAKERSLSYAGANSVIFAKRTQSLVDEVLDQYSVSGAQVSIQDQGAIAVTMRARLETALKRASQEESCCAKGGCCK